MSEAAHSAGSADAGSPAVSPPVRVAFDATACLGVRTGVGRFAHEVLQRIADHSGLAVTAFAVSWRGRGTLDELVPPGVRVVNRPMAARPLRIAWQHFDRPRIESWTGPIDVVHGPNYVVPPARDAARILTVHDLTPLRFPELANEHTRTYPQLIAAAVAAGGWVQTPTAFIRAEVIDHFDVDPDRVVAVPYGITPLDPESSTTDGAAGHRLAGSDRYVLALGTIEPRKDLTALISAFDLVAEGDDGLRLVVAGPDGWGADEVNRAIEASPHRMRIVRLGRVDEATRAALLRGASVLAYPSRYEGFGLPPLEAMDAGVPVVTTNAGSLPEVLGDAASFVDAEAFVSDRDVGIQALSDALGAVLGDADLRADLIRRGHERARQYDWQHTADGLVGLYRQAVATR